MTNNTKRRLGAVAIVALAVCILAADVSLLTSGAAVLVALWAVAMGGGKR